MEATTSKITVETTINAPVAKVWEQFTAPEHITQWCQASDDWHAPFAENDVREGGSFKTTMAAKDGSFSFDFGGIYSEVKENALLDYNMSDGRNVRVLFSSEGDSTKVTEIFDPETTHPIEMQRGGWQAILDNFKKHVESH
ncbi:SRPBCC family protein [Dyadobacter sp. MSC1_007]|jgi:uncharacterized protein YndB with AHSA1/START domain|uniref:SRPBCC family protein n=1 Tax=Dyadobacter sp. MSC1_007 TaxID=2909264 RepID=UPI0020304178|nr:SRPBCC family protein [Dyadobacter sp. MSC1_007]